MLRRDLDNNHNYNKANWAYHVKHILEELGLSDACLNQDYITIPLFSIKQRLIDQYVQSWYFAVDTSFKLANFKMFKTNFCYEKYLSKITNSNLRKILSRFRLSSHKLAIETTGRYDNTPHVLRKCMPFNMEAVETEYHFLLACPKYSELRHKYFSQNMCSWPTLQKCYAFLSKYFLDRCTISVSIYQMYIS
jgi:hypothetical protein